MISFRVSMNTPFLMELHLDFGGDLIMDVLLPNSLTFDVVKAGIKLMAGENFIIKKNLLVSPTSVIYDAGKKLNSEKNYSVIKKNSLKKVLISIDEKIKYIYD